MKKIESYNLQTEEEKKDKNEAFAKKTEAIIKVLQSDGWEYVKEILLEQMEEKELREICSRNGVTDFKKIGELFYLEDRANSKIKKGITEIESYSAN